MKCKLINPVFKDNYLKNLLEFYGIEDLDEFLIPNSSNIQSWDALDNIEEGVKLLLENLNKRILLVVDCDCDGFTSSAILWNYLKKIKPDIQIDYVLHEKKQHGLEDHIDWLLESNTYYDLIICPDASSNDKVYHDQLGEIGTKILVLDHHILETEVSEHAVVINNQSSAAYKNKELTGAGVTWQFCRALDDYFKTTYSSDLIDLAALGIVGDMGGLNEIENQTIVQIGLDHITNKFFDAIVRKQDYSMQSTVNPTTVAFYVVPLINAMVRVGTMEEKERMFEAFINPFKMVPNNKRGCKGTEVEVYEESLRECVNAKARQDREKEKIVESLEVKIMKHDLLSNKILFIRLEDEDDFPSEMNGLIAMQLAAKYKRPTIVARLNNEGYVRGSARGLNDSELKSFKNFLSGTALFEHTSGHDQAFGLSIHVNDMSALHSYANKALEDMNLEEEYYEVNFKFYSMDDNIKDVIYEIGNNLHLFGQKVPEPLINVESINLKSSDINIIGSKKDTLKFEKNGVTYIKFHAKDLINELSDYKNEIQIDVVGRCNINRWMGNETPQIMIKAYEIRDGKLAF